ncbi:hypothetical protein [Cylindrospermum stagnale]|uniref:hypothetical protein n=1 Tax=Cylindrospermum stagnale TaxID=142864 RepID=UPI001FE1751E|nr:hypothetical protein [Cylindrospermum stagnale]
MIEVQYWDNLQIEDYLGFIEDYQQVTESQRIALNALERESSFHRSIRQKSRRAAMNDLYMVSVLAAALPHSTLC